MVHPVGHGRGGEDHQLIVANLAAEASRLGFRALKECVVAGGRIDLVVERARLRIAIEVAVNSNTAHEVENLQKCAEANPISSSRFRRTKMSVLSLRRPAARMFDSETLAKVRFESPDTLIFWLREIAERNPEIVPPEIPQRGSSPVEKVRTRHVEMSA
ncbi:MAG: hypothetical protein WDN28_26420 [Chthoniobacter sp.]